jgi:hypothetical protein
MIDIPMLKPPQQPPVSRGELMWLALGVLVSLVVHGAFVIHGLGEPDAARLTREAIVWSEVGQMPGIGYTPRTSPLYIHWMKEMLSLGLPPLWLPAVMNWTSLLLGSLSLVPLYLLGRRIASPSAAAAGLIVYSFMPAWWLGNIYGMPLVPAFFCFASSLLLFARWIGLSSLSNLKSLISIFATAVLAVAAVSLKADIVLCFGAFLLFALWQRPLKLRNTIAALVIPLIAVFLTTRYTKLIEPQIIYSTDTWSNRWGFTWEVLTVWGNARVPLVAAGIVLAGIIAALLLYSLVFRRHTAILWLIFFWGLPAILFWCSKPGNSARHMMASYAPLALLVGAVLTSKWDWQKWAMALFTILLLNYINTDLRDMPDTVRPSSNIFSAQRHIQKMVTSWHDSAREFAMLPDEKKVLYGEDNSTYAAWEVLARAKHFRYEPDGNGYIVTREDGSEQLVRVIYHLRDEKPVVPEPGWSTWVWLDYRAPVKVESGT